MVISKSQFLEFVCGKNESKKYDVEFKAFNKNSYKALIKLKFPNDDLKSDNTVAILILNDYYCVLEWQKGVILYKPVDMTEEYRRFVVLKLLKMENSEDLIQSYLSNLIGERKEKYFE